jgi:hypothetical protein
MAKSVSIVIDLSVLLKQLFVIQDNPRITSDNLACKRFYAEIFFYFKFEHIRQIADLAICC